MYHPPRIIIFTDGKISDADLLTEVKNKVTDMLKITPLFVFIVSLEAEDVNLKEIQKVTDADIVEFNQTSIVKFLDYLGRSIRSKPNEKGQRRPKDVSKTGARER